MDQLRYVSSSTENSRNLGLPKKPTVNDYLIQKPMTPIIDRFKAMLRGREENIKALGLHGGEDDDDTISPPRCEEIVKLYEIVLCELTFNSKPIITDLTIIAGEQREHAEGIANAICQRIIQAPVDQKLPCLYLLDSIAKNIGKEYVRYFSVLLPEVFCEVYKQVNSSLRTSMGHLFGTWSTVFPPSILCKIEAQMKFSPAPDSPSVLASLQPSESPRPTHGIHVNPKYLEARRQYEHTTIRSDILHSSGTPSLKMNGKRAAELGGYGSDNSEGLTTQVGTKRISSSIRANTSKAENMHMLASARDANSSTPFVTSHVRSPGSDTEFDSTSMFLKISSPSRRGFDYGGVVNNGKKESSDWQRGYKSHDNHQEYDYHDAHSYSNSAELRGPRALIDAYGTDERDTCKHPKATHLNMNAVNNKMAVQTWKDNEEEEFKWEDMSPTLATGNMNSSLFSSSNPTSGNLTAVPGAEPQHPVLMENSFRRGHQSGREQMSAISDSSLISDSVHGLMNNVYGVRNEASQFPASRNPLEVWNFPQSSQRNLQKHMWRQLEPMSAGYSNVDQGMKNSFTAPNHQPQFPNRQVGPISSLQQNHAQNVVLRPAYQMRPNVHQNMLPPTGISTPSHVAYQPFGRGYIPPGHRPFVNPGFMNPAPSMQSSMPIPNVRNSSAHLSGVVLPPLPPEPRPISSQMIPGQNHSLVPLNPPGGGALSGLFNSLMAQGLISLTNQASVQDSVGLEFNTDLLKVRHESAISALYADLPRQCTTCGLRFKCQEEHSSHMDWHVTRNRTSKNRKQKPSRRWFVSADMWLSGTEALGADAAPGFLPTEIVQEKDDEESAVPADEDQIVCALCGEPFVDFYSDETEEWMYKGAAYMNAPAGSATGMDRSQLGPIVHTKCKSDSNVTNAEDLSKNEMGYTEDGGRTKRLRV
ncbi:Polyadenylation and cleavage factor 4 [Heracleum sosnowskyi]|uniref:Polyadenylation and cleavage factor 4 n=1 Tax=Heracleum sosnowskyi TaxID=360622 RepID=A0AAD8HZC4_9APIA|nr:Polyadenylation and cleavage factor 4 [Heracleum sosnowskyi]